VCGEVYAFIPNNMQAVKNKFNKKFLTAFFSFVFMFGGVFALPMIAVAVEGDPGSDSFQLAPKKGECAKNEQGVEECNFNDLMKLLNKFMQFLIWLSASLAILAFCYAGFLYVTAFGEGGKIEQAHKIFSSTITGIIIIMIAWLIVATILKTLEVDQNFSVINFGSVQTIQGK
jgi:Type IV secretion system pilin